MRLCGEQVPRQDTMTPVEAARTFVARTHASFASFDGGHGGLVSSVPSTR
jgi:hypothetical protein